MPTGEHVVVFLGQTKTLCESQALNAAITTKLRENHFRRILPLASPLNPAACAALVRSFVSGKTLNQRTVLRRALRDHGEGMAEPARAALAVAEARLTDIARRAQRDQGTDALRGLEGARRPPPTSPSSTI